MDRGFRSLVWAICMFGATSTAVADTSSYWNTQGRSRVGQPQPRPLFTPPTTATQPQFGTYGNSKSFGTFGGPRVAENGDVRGFDNDGDGRRESTYVQGYQRNDGTYVRGHYRAHPYRR